MKRTALALAAVGLAFGLSACGTDKPDTVVVQAPPVEQPATVPAGQQFVDAIHGVTDEFNGVPDSDLVAAGRETCSNIGVYGFDQTGLAMLANEGATAKQAGVMLAASVRFLCPQYTPEFEAWTQSSSATV